MDGRICPSGGGGPFRGVGLASEPPAVVCFLRDLDSEQLYRITVFRDPETQQYGPQGFNFSAVPPGTSLTLEIHQNHSGTFRIQAAQLA